MTLKRIYSFCPVIVLLSGIISCSQDKEINYQPTPVQGFNVGALDSERKMQWALDITELDMGGELTIDLLQKQDVNNNPVKVHIYSTCRSPLVTDAFYNNVHFQNKFSIPVLQIPSTGALLALDDQPLTCDIELTLTDGFSSRAVYDLKGVKIKNSAEFSNISYIPDVSTVIFYDQQKLEALPAGIKHLHCSDFSKNSSNSDVKTWEQIMNSSENDMSLWTRSTQTCRLLTQDNDHIYLSSRFQLVFQPQPLVIRHEYDPIEKPTHEFTPRKVISLKLTNPNSFSVRVKASHFDESTMGFLPAYSGTGRVGYVGNYRTFPLTWSLQNDLFLIDDKGSEKEFIIPANQEVIFDGTYQGQIHCDSQDAVIPPQGFPVAIRRPILVGMLYGFDLKIQFQIHLAQEHWQNIETLQGEQLSKLKETPHPWWDLFYEEVRASYGSRFLNPAQSNHDFTLTMNWNQRHDVCRTF